MFGIGSTEFIVILLVALLVLGPKSLAKISRTVGKYMGEFRRVSTEFQRTLNVEAAEEERKRKEKEAEEERLAAEKKEKSVMHRIFGSLKQFGRSLVEPEPGSND